MAGVMVVEAHRVEERLAAYLREALGDAATSITPSTNLVERGVLDSLATLDLIDFVAAEFGVELTHDGLMQHGSFTMAGIAAFIRHAIPQEGSTPCV